MKQDPPYKPDFIGKWTNDPDILEGQRNYYGALKRHEEIYPVERPRDRCVWEKTCSFHYDGKP